MDALTELKAIDPNTCTIEQLRSALKSAASHCYPLLSPELQFAGVEETEFDIRDLTLRGSAGHLVPAAAWIVLLHKALIERRFRRTVTGVLVAMLAGQENGSLGEPGPDRACLLDVPIDAELPFRVADVVICTINAVRTVNDLVANRVAEEKVWGDLSAPGKHLRVEHSLGRVLQSLARAKWHPLDRLSQRPTGIVVQRHRVEDWYEAVEIITEIRRFTTLARVSVDHAGDLGDGDLPIDKRWVTRTTMFLDRVESLFGAGVSGLDVPEIRERPAVIGARLLRNGWANHDQIGPLLESGGELYTAYTVAIKAVASKKQNDPAQVWKPSGWFSKACSAMSKGKVTFNPIELRRAPSDQVLRKKGSGAGTTYLFEVNSACRFGAFQGFAPLWRSALQLGRPIRLRSRRKVRTASTRAPKPRQRASAT